MTCSRCSRPREKRGDGGFYSMCRRHRILDRERLRKQRKERPEINRSAVQRYKDSLTPDERKTMEAQIAKRWKTRHPERNSFNSRQYERRKRNATGTCTEAQLQARIDFYGRRCYLCGCDWDALPKQDQTIDHVIPISKGGTNWPVNLRPACRTCNTQKRDKSFEAGKA